MSGLLLKNVSKSFDKKLAVDNISFELQKPGIYGLLGTNGAGKTTTIRMLLGILTKDSGEITWNGEPVSRETVNFGYLPEERGVYSKIKIIDQLLYFAELKGMDKNLAQENIEKWSKQLKVDQYLNLPAEKLSKGNQQKIQFLIAIVHNPDLIVMDEPFSGLDPVNTDLIKSVIIHLIHENKFIIMSAHQMSTIEEFCQDILILDKGKTVLQGNLKEIKNSYPATHLELSTNSDIKSFLKSAKLKVEHENGFQYLIKITSEDDAEKLLQQLVAAKVKITKFEIMKPTLNDIFIEKVGASK